MAPIVDGSTGDNRDMENRSFEDAEVRLERAEAELKVAEAEVRRAAHDIEEAEAEIKEAQAHHHAIHFTVDGEPFETEEHKLTPDQIIREFGGQDPATNYLVQIKGGEKISYQGKGGEPIELHDGMSFQIISIGPTPVSDGPIDMGVKVFRDGLRDLGYEPAALPGKPDHVIIDYKVQTGRQAGQTVRHGFIVPPDFPMNPPTGPHVSPRIHPINPTQGPHPTGGVHQSPFEQGPDAVWQYWSRPFPNWATSKKTVAVYMRHIWRLWDTQ